MMELIPAPTPTARPDSATSPASIPTKETAAVCRGPAAAPLPASAAPLEALLCVASPWLEQAPSAGDKGHGRDGARAASAHPKPEAVFSDEDAAAVRERWDTSGSATQQDIARATPEFKKWKAAFTRGLANERKHKKRKLSDEQIAAAWQWLADFERHGKWLALKSGPEPTDPGPLAAHLTPVAGSLPAHPFEKIKRHDVTVPGGGRYAYDDHVRSQYTTFEEGVGDSGHVGGESKIGAVFSEAGITSPDPAMVEKAFTILSRYEGKFDAINTYDNGRVSVGMIQFIANAKGTGSLAAVLRDMKAKAPAEFNAYFHDLGIDVTAQGLVVVDPATGTVLHGAKAVQLMMQDKRFAAAFQNAGARSSEFQYAQARTAYAMYYTPDQTFSIRLFVPVPKKKQPRSVTISGRYRDILQSEAGKVALVDRSVQRGTGEGKGAAGTFRAACQKIVNKYNLLDPTASELARYELLIVQKLKNRHPVLDDAKLTQPPEPPAALPTF